MPKETQKEKIERLERELQEARAITNQKIDQIVEMQDQANEAFANSTDKMQLDKKIFLLEQLLKSAEHRVELAEKKVEAWSKHLQELKNENDDLNRAIARHISDKVDLRAELEEVKHNLEVSQKLNDEKNVSMIAERATKRGFEIEKLKEEIQKLKNEQTYSVQEPKRSNERGAGRKERFSDAEKESIKMYRMQKKSIKEIADMYECSVGLIHKILTNG